MRGLSTTKELKKTMINENTQVRLSIKLQGRLGAKAPNASSKRQRAKAMKAAKYGKVLFQKFNQTKEQHCYQSINIPSESVQFFISDDGRPLRTPPSTWKKTGREERLKMNLQITADAIAGVNNAEFGYKLIN